MGSLWEGGPTLGGSLKKSLKYALKIFKEFHTSQKTAGSIDSNFLPSVHRIFPFYRYVYIFCWWNLGRVFGCILKYLFSVIKNLTYLYLLVTVTSYTSKLAPAKLLENQVDSLWRLYNRASFHTNECMFFTHFVLKLKDKKSLRIAPSSRSGINTIPEVIVWWTSVRLSPTPWNLNNQYLNVPSLKLRASSHLKMDGWKMIVSFWDGLFSGANS